MFILHTSPLFHVDALKEYDVVLCSLLLSILRALRGRRLRCQFGWVVWDFVPQCSLPLHVTSLRLLLLVVSLPSSYPTLLLPIHLGSVMRPWPVGLTLSHLSHPQWMVGRQSRKNGTTFRLELPLTTSQLGSK